MFPENWDEDKIIDVTEKIAANDNLDWGTRKNGNLFAQIMEDGVLVRVVMDPERQYVITSYPLNTRRTPCPRDEDKAAANDNTSSAMDDQDQDEEASPIMGKLLDLKDLDIEHKHDYNR